MKKTLSLLLAFFILSLTVMTVFSGCSPDSAATKPHTDNSPSKNEESIPEKSDPNSTVNPSLPVIAPSSPNPSDSAAASPSEPDDTKNNTNLTLDELKILWQHLKDNQTSENPISKEEQQKIEDQIKEAVEANKDPISNKDVYNVMLIGYDYKTVGGPKNSDTMILISINFKAQTFTMTSFMRDSLVQIPGVGNNRLNVAYAVSGYPLLKTTIQNNFGISIDNYVALTFKTFIDFYDAIGGMDVNITDDQISYLNKNIPLYYQAYAPEGYDIKTTPIVKGVNHLDGVQLLTYVRNRSTGGSSDFGRTERQRALIGDTIKKMATMSVDELYDLMDMMLPQVTTDIPANECTSLLMKMITRNVFGYTQQSMRIPDSGTWKEAIIVLAGTNQQVLSMDYKENTRRFKKLVYGIDS